MMPGRSTVGAPRSRRRCRRRSSRCARGGGAGGGPAVAAAAASAVVPAVPAVAPGGAPAGRGFGRGGGRGRGGTQGAFGRRRRPSGPWPQVEEAAASRVRQHAGARGRAASRVPRGDGSTIVRLRRGAVADRLRREDRREPGQPRQVLFHLGEMATATQSLDEDTFGLLGAELGYDIQVVSPGGRGPRAARHLRHRHRGRGRGRRGVPESPAAGRHRHGSRRPRQDQAARRDPQRPTWSRARPVASPSTSAPTRCTHRARGRRPRDHLHRHPGSRGVHRHACPWCAGRPTSRSWWSRPTTA